MYPPQTSLIPVTVALAKFVEVNGLASMFGHYPYWYLGVSYQYLTGPIVPLLQVIFHKIIPVLSLFEITYALLFLSFLASIVGWGILTKKASGNRFIGTIVGVLLLILPWRYLFTLALSEASATISKNLLPFALLAFWHYYKKRSRRRAMYAVLSLAVLLLINTTVLAVFVVGVSALVLGASFKKGKFRGLTGKVKRTVILVALSLAVATFWYTPGYWITVLVNPSIGGASGIKVFLRIFDLLRASIPLILAIGAVYFSGKIKNRLTIFSLTWVFTFLFLSVFRFIGDPDFWQDWTSWFSEIEVGIAIVLSQVIARAWKTRNFQLKSFSIWHLALVILLLVSPFLLTNHVYELLNKPKLISNSIPKGVQSLKKLSELVAGGSTELTTLRVFLSGSTVFWANSLYDINQVRGGIDKAATHPYWDHAAFQLREGTRPELAKAWLEALGVSKVLIHTSASTEIYHDFRNVDKWNEVGDIAWEDKGDVIIRVRESSRAWVVDLTSLENVSPPEGGVDIAALNNYLSTKIRPLETKISTNKIVISIDNLKEGEGIVIAESYSKNWKASDGFKIDKDPLGNILIIPKNYSSSTISLEYK